MIRRTRSGSITPFSHRKSILVSDVSPSPLNKESFRSAPVTAPSYSDMNSRICYLELQLQELRAENKSLTRGLNGLMMFVEDFKKYSSHPISAGTSLIGHYDNQKSSPLNVFDVNSPVLEPSPRSIERRKNIFSKDSPGGVAKLIDRSQSVNDMSAFSSPPPAATESEPSGAVNLAIHIDSPKSVKIPALPPSTGRPPKPTITVSVPVEVQPEAVHEEEDECKKEEPVSSSRSSKNVPGMMKLPGIGSVELGKLKHVQQKPKEEDHLHENKASVSSVQINSPSPPPPPPPPPPPSLNKLAPNTSFSTAQLDAISVLVLNTVKYEVSMVLDHSEKRRVEEDNRLRGIIDEKVVMLRAELIALIDQKIKESIQKEEGSASALKVSQDSDVRSEMESSLHNLLNERLLSERQLLIAIINENIQNIAIHKSGEATAALEKEKNEKSSESNAEILVSSNPTEEATADQEAKMNLFEAQLGLIIAKLETLAPISASTGKLDSNDTEAVQINTDLMSNAPQNSSVDREELNKRISQTINFQLNHRQTESAEDLGRYSFERSSQHPAQPLSVLTGAVFSHSPQEMGVERDIVTMSRSRSLSPGSSHHTEVVDLRHDENKVDYGESRRSNFDSNVLPTSIVRDSSTSKYVPKESKLLSEYNRQFLADTDSNGLDQLHRLQTRQHVLSAPRDESSGELAKLFSSYLSAVNKCEDIVPNPIVSYFYQ